MKNIFSETKCLSPADIDQYLAGKLSRDRHFNVEHHLLDCPLCNAAVEGHQAADPAEENFMDEVYDLVDRRLENTKQPAVHRLFWNRIAAAAVFLLSIAAAWLYYQNRETQQYLAYFEDQSDIITTRGTSDDLLTEDLIAGVRLYEQKNYQGSLSFFEDYMQQKEAGMASYYAGLSALKTGDLGLAEKYLQTARLNEAAVYEPATWYLSKVYLDKDRPDEAKLLLQDLSQIEGGFYTELAAALLRDLE